MAEHGPAVTEGVFRTLFGQDEWTGRSRADQWRTKLIVTTTGDRCPTEADVIAAPDLVLTPPARRRTSLSSGTPSAARRRAGHRGSGPGRRQARGDRGCTQRRRPRVLGRRGADGGRRHARRARPAAVRDEGRGMPRARQPRPRPRSPPLIATLAETLEPGRSSDDRTEVRMTFSIHLGLRRGAVGRMRPNPENQATMLVRNGPLLGPVLSRVIGMFAARPLPDRPARRCPARRRHRRRPRPGPRPQRPGQGHAGRPRGCHRADGRRARGEGDAGRRRAARRNVLERWPTWSRSARTATRRCTCASASASDHRRRVIRTRRSDDHRSR